MAQNYIIWRGQDSRDVEGLIISSLPPVTKPAMRFEETEIDGRDGSIIEQMGYQAYDKTVTIGLRGDYDLDEIVAFFTGSGSLVFSNEDERVYTAAILEAADFSRLLRFRTAEVKWHVQPYKHVLGECARVLEASPAQVVNSGTVPARPVIRLEGSGTVAVKINGAEVFRYTFDQDGAVVIDAEAEDAAFGSVLKNRNMIGGFPELQPGGNTIEYTGKVSKFEIKINTRFI